MSSQSRKQNDTTVPKRGQHEVLSTSPSISSTSNTEVETWLAKSYDTPDALTALEYAQRASDVNPDDPRIQAAFQHILMERLKHDPRIAFLAETDTHYVVTVRDSRPLLIPKTREIPEGFPLAEHTEAERVLGMVHWIVLGLILGGIGALIASVLVLLRAFRVLKQPDLAPRDRRLAWLAVALAGVLGLVGEFFTLLLVLHIMG